jgi:hypothetical protein
VNFFAAACDQRHSNLWEGRAVISVRRSSIFTPKSARSVVAAVGVLAMAGFAQASGSPFSLLSGTWAGPGTITLASGAREAIRCRATYSVDRAGANLDLRLRCASASFKFELQSNAAHSNGAVSGSWTEMTRHVGGTIAGSASGSRIQVLVQGTLAAHLAVDTRANRQSISIEAPGSEMSAVKISLSRTGR